MVFVNVFWIASMMHSMVTGGIKYPFQWSELAYGLCMNPKLIKRIKRTHCNKHDGIKANQSQRQIKKQ